MSDVISAKEPKIREFIINELKKLEAKESLNIAISILEETKDLEEGITERIIRDTRDNN